MATNIDVLSAQIQSLINCHTRLEGKLDNIEIINNEKNGTWVTKHDALEKKRDVLEKKHDVLEKKHGVPAKERDALAKEHDALEKKYETLKGDLKLVQDETARVRYLVSYHFASALKYDIHS